MKTFKKLIAIILCIAAISGLCVTGASAYTKSEYEEFIYADGSSGLFVYAGEVSEGENFIEYTDEYDSCFFFVRFEASESGNYYFVGSGNMFFQLQGSDMKETENEICYYSEDSFFTYLEKGTYYIIDDFYGCSPEPQDEYYEIGFLGEFTGVSYNKDAFKNAVAYADVDFHNKNIRHAAPKVNFTESSLDYGLGTLYLETDKELELGENTVTINILDYEFTETLTIIKATDFIESIEVENIERYTARRRCYDGKIVYDSVYPEELKVTFTDGTSRIVEGVKEYDFSDTLYYSFELSNGRIYHIYVDVYPNGFEVNFGGYRYIYQSAEYTEASFRENLAQLGSNIFEISIDFSKPVNKFIAIMDELKEFCSYYISSISIF